MKIGVISDTHLMYGEELPEEVYTIFKEVDMIFHAGDVNFPGVLDELASIAPIYAVMGNTDPVDLDLPRKIEIEIENRKVGLIHGYGAIEGLESRIKEEFDEINIIVYGHTHIPTYHQEGGIIFFNPGSACVPKRNNERTIGILTIEDDVTGEIIKI